MYAIVTSIYKIQYTIDNDYNVDWRYTKKVIINGTNSSKKCPNKNRDRYKCDRRRLTAKSHVALVMETGNVLQILIDLKKKLSAIL